MYIGNNFAVKRNTCEVLFSYYANEFDNGLTKLYWLQKNVYKQVHVQGKMKLNYFI